MYSTYRASGWNYMMINWNRSLESSRKTTWKLFLNYIFNFQSSAIKWVFYSSVKSMKFYWIFKWFNSFYMFLKRLMKKWSFRPWKCSENSSKSTFGVSSSFNFSIMFNMWDKHTEINLGVKYKMHKKLEIELLNVIAMKWETFSHVDSTRGLNEVVKSAIVCLRVTTFSLCWLFDTFCDFFMRYFLGLNQLELFF